jgi:repressor LexA
MLSKRQYSILQFVHNYTSEYSFAPSIREIRMATGITSTSIVNYNVEKLIARGYLVKSPGKSRTITLTEKSIALIESYPADKRINGQCNVNL